MRSIDLRIPAIALLAVALVSFAPAFGAEPLADNANIQFTSGTGNTEDLPAAVPDTVAPISFADKNADAASDLNGMAEKLANPTMQAGVSTMVKRMTETMMHLPVGKFAAAVEKSMPSAMKGKHRIAEGATIADLAGRDADRLPTELAKGSKQMMGLLSGFAAAFATMVPEFEKMGDELGKELQSAKLSAD